MPKHPIVRNERTKRIAELKALGKDRVEIAADLGISVGVLQTFCSVNGIKLPLKFNLQDRARKIENLADQGLSRDEISSALSIKMTSLQEWCSRNQVKLPPRSSSVDNIRKGNVIVRASIPERLATDLKAEAETRHVGVIDFTASILSAVAEGKLYNAVLEQ